MQLIENIKDRIFRQVQKRHPRTPRYQSYRSAKRVLIIFESDRLERNVQLKALVKQLQADGKEVTAWGFVPDKKKAESAVLRDYRVLAQDDFNFWGLPNEIHRADVARERFDLLIDLNINDLRQLRYLNLYAQVDFRAGKQTDAPWLCDFMVDTKADSNPAFLFDQILFYLKQVETK